MDWFAVDKEGLAAILERRGKAFAVLELVSNAFDAPGTNEVKVVLEPIPGRPYAKLVVEDDAPDGFADLSHSYTLFAPSERKVAAEKRGRFNVGEKLVLAICEEAEIVSTKGRVVFDREGRRTLRRQWWREAGSIFEGTIRMTRDELRDAVAALDAVLVPDGIVLTVNGIPVCRRPPLHVVEATLPTEIADAEGNLRRTRRKTTARIFEPLPHETATLYELGIPVVATGDRWHVDVGQKIPLNMDRDNVTPGFLAEIRALVLNTMHERITGDEATTAWVREAAERPECSPEAIRRILDERFGTKRVAYDPSDAEANHRAVAEGYTVVHGRALSAGEWENARKANAIKPAGQVAPTPKPFSPDGKPLQIIPPDAWTEGMARAAVYASRLAERLLNATPRMQLVVSYANDPSWSFAGTYERPTDRTPARLYLNLAKLGRGFFDGGATEDFDRLLLHEFAHHFEGNHLADGFAEAGFRLGARLKKLALEEPELFDMKRNA